MIDTFRPLRLARAAGPAEDPEYAWSWANAARARAGSAEADRGPGF
jgi:hypothetical protein